MEVTVNVTARDITRGERSDCGKCPVALALRCHFPDAFFVGVFGTYAMVTQNVRGGYVVARLPPEAVNFVSRFDGLTRRAVKPFRFKLQFE